MGKEDLWECIVCGKELPQEQLAPCYYCDEMLCEDCFNSHTEQHVEDGTAVEWE